MPHAELLGDLVYDGDWRAPELGWRPADAATPAAPPVAARGGTGR
ncbi:hypothetical protein [Streptomyces zaehneri]|nr:hypothetical protein [Streptomyces sp. DSM 40713]